MFIVLIILYTLNTVIVAGAIYWLYCRLNGIEEKLQYLEPLVHHELEEQPIDNSEDHGLVGKTGVDVDNGLETELSPEQQIDHVEPISHDSIVGRKNENVEVICVDGIEPESSVVDEITVHEPNVPEEHCSDVAQLNSTGESVIPSQVSPQLLPPPPLLRERIRPPVARGGGQMEASGDNSQPEGYQPPNRRGLSCLRMMCFKDEDRLWRIAVELPEDCSSGVEIQARHDDQTLEPTSFGVKQWILHRIGGGVRANELRLDGQEWKIELDQEEWVCFKILSESENDVGQRVKTVSAGEYLILQPQDWPPPRIDGARLSREQNIGLEGYDGFSVMVDEPAATRIDVGRVEQAHQLLTVRGSSFSLTGNLAERSYGENRAPLFLESPPSLLGVSEDSWARVHKIVLGVAGRGIGNWRLGFTPEPLQNCVHLTEQMQDRIAGWYFARFYDEAESLIDSQYFAYAAALHSVRVLEVELLPTDGLHQDAKLEFEHESDIGVMIHGHHERLNAVGGSRFIIPAHSESESVKWQITCQGAPILTCTTEIDRVWWSLASSDDDPNDQDWNTERGLCGFADFSAASNRLLYVRLPAGGGVRTFHAGFSRESARHYSAVAKCQIVPVRLGDFVDADPVSRIGRFPFKIWVSGDDHEEAADVLDVLIQLNCKFCGQRFDSEDQAVRHSHEHRAEFIRELTYDEHRILDNALPPAIYKCTDADCDEYVRADDPVNPTTEIISHILHAHPASHGPTAIEYEIITDLDEIRQNLALHLPRIYRCTKCNHRFEEPGEWDLEYHIFSQHKAQCYELC